MRLWRAMLAILLLVLGTASAPTIVRASCVGATLPELRDRADVIVSGQVTSIDQSSTQTYYTVTLNTVYKGSPKNPLVVYSPTGSGKVTSVDYRMTGGTVHTLYLRMGSSGYYETDACAGSHEGQPTADELKLLGQGQTAPPPSKAPTLPSGSWIPFTAIGVTAVAVLLVLWSIRRANRQS